MTDRSTGPDSRVRMLLDAARRIVGITGNPPRVVEVPAARPARADEDLSLLEVLPMVLSGDPGTAEAAEARIRDELGMLSPRALVAADEKIRRTYSWIGYGPYSYAVVPAGVSRMRGADVLGLASMHPNGHVREAAAHELDGVDTGGELAYLLVRLNDWVERVRRRARVAVQRRLTPEYAPHLVRNLWLAERLAACGRDDHAPLLAEIRAFLRGAARVALSDGTGSSDLWVRRTCYAMLLDPPSADVPEIVRRALADQDNLTRLRGLRRAEALLAPAQLGEALPSLLADPFAPVRREALRLWIEHAPESAEDALRMALLDRHPSLRDMARRELRARGIGGFAEVYRAALYRVPAAALAGLGETGSADDAPYVEPFLSAGSAGVRRAAVMTMAQLAPEPAVPHFVRALADENRGVSKAARIALAPRAGRVGSAALWELVTEGGAEHVRRNALLLIAALGKWESIGWLLRACALEEDGVTRDAAALVRRWKDRFNRSGVQPAGDQLDRAKQALEAAAPKLRHGLAPELRFLMKDF